MLEDLRQSLKKNTEHQRESLEAALDHLEREEEEIESEILLLSGQKPFIREDLQDSAKAVEESYVQDIYTSWSLASKGGAPPKKALSRKEFARKVAKYLETVKSLPDTAAQQLWCNVLGYQTRDMVKCAHIVPFCFESKQLDYMFGAEESALHSERNGLYLNRVIEGARDSGWVAIVPDGTVEKTPTEWKLVVVKDKMKNDTVYTGFDGHITRWKDIDGVRLQFRNGNRPARRYLYFRFVMSYMKASKEGYSNMQKKLPNGRIWASPSKLEGYLRKSVLQRLAKRIGDEPLPTDLLEAGSFEDTEPKSGHEEEDEVAAIAVTHRLRKRQRGELAGVENEEEEEDSDEE